jgi:hypothetical protein
VSTPREAFAERDRALIGDTADVAEDPAQKLHPAEHRAYRELYVSCRQLVNRWGRLIEALKGTESGETLQVGASRVRELLEALPARTEPYGLHGGIAAQGLGARIADVRGAVTDRSVDTGMVMRLAVLDVEHVTTLLGHLAALAGARSDRELTSVCREWEATMRPQVKAVRKEAVELGSHPDRAAAPLDSSLLGRVAHGAGWVMGSVGEAVDRVTGSRAGADKP